MRCELKVVESKAGDEVVDSEDMGGLFGFEDDGVVNTHANMSKSFGDTVHEMMKGSRGARNCHESMEPLEEAFRGAECCELDRRVMGGRFRKP